MNRASHRSLCIDINLNGNVCYMQRYVRFKMIFLFVFERNMIYSNGVYFVLIWFRYFTIAFQCEFFVVYIYVILCWFG